MKNVNEIAIRVFNVYDYYFKSLLEFTEFFCFMQYFTVGCTDYIY